MEDIFAIVLSSSSQGLLWAVMAIGIYLMYRILDIADLTAEGAFPLGGATCVALISLQGWNPILATSAGMVVGAIAGLVSGLLHTKLKIPALLTGILTMTGLYTVNLRIMGQGNLPLTNNKTIVSSLGDFLDAFGISRDMTVLVLGLIVTGIIILVLYFFFNTSLGLAIRATGDNEEMSLANGINVDLMKIIGYMISNALIALSGALMAQNNSYADLNMGIGTIVIGLASIIIAEVIFKNLTLVKRLLTVILGAIIYRLILAFVLELGVEPSDLKFFSALILTIALGSPLISEKFFPKKIKPVSEGVS
ncbi:MAG: ABC transporter permease [Culicoidibacterales bacterium]